MPFIVVDGPNGAGKTTLIQNLSDIGYESLSSPNGTPLAKMLRPACRGTEPWEDIDPGVQFLLFSAARLDEYIRRVHNNPDIVVADRWWTSTVVYQCWLQGIPEEFLEYTIHPVEKIDLYIYLDAQDDTLIERVINERKKNSDHGICSWTKKKDTIRELASLYRKLPDWLKEKKGIPTKYIDTTILTAEEVFKESIHAIQHGS